MDIYSRLLKDRIIFLGTPVDDQVANAIMASYFTSKAKTRTRISTCTSTPRAAALPPDSPSTTRCSSSSPISLRPLWGMAASMGAFLLAAGANGKRNALPNTRILLHQPSVGGLAGQASDVEIHAKELIATKQRLNEILSQNTGQPYDRIENDTDRDYIMGPEEGIEYGVIDNIVRNH